MGLQYILAAGIVFILIVLFYLIRIVREISANTSQKKTGEGVLRGVAGDRAVSAEEIPEEIVAAISAAVYVLYPDAKIRGVRRLSVRNGTSAWRTAGLLENTRPF